jgi:hypothetical protein
MFADTRPAELDPLDGANAWSEFRVGNPRERLALLRQLRDAGATIVVTGPDGSSLNTTLWSVDDAVLALAVDTGAAALQKLLDHDDALAVAYIEAVKLQFDLRGLVLVRGTHASVLQCATPSEIYRFQRRQHYRVRTDESQGPVACLPHPMRPGAAAARCGCPRHSRCCSRVPSCPAPRSRWTPRRTSRPRCCCST